MLLERLEEKFRNRQSSYMMVVILAMLDLAWPSGKAMLNDVVNYFKGFYERRLQVGKKPEKEGLRLFSVSTLTDIEIRRTVIENPVRYLQDFLFYDGNREELRFQDDLLPELTNENTRFAIRKLAYKHLYNYYQTFTTNHLTWDELVNLPPGYAVKASDVAYLSGHNQVKGIHPVEHDGEKAVIVLCTIGGDNYANEWLTDDRRRLKYYLEGRTDRNSGRRKYDPELPTNKAVINSRFERAVPHVGSTWYYEQKFRPRTVLVGVVRDQKQLTANLAGSFYHIPYQQIRKDCFYLDYVALYQPERTFGNNAGIYYYGSIAKMEVLKRKEITELPSGREELYVKFSVKGWEKLPEPIKPVGYGVRSHIYTTMYLLKQARELPELSLTSEAELRLWKEIRRLRKDIKLRVNHRNLSPSSKVDTIEFGQVIIKVADKYLHIGNGEEEEHIPFSALLNKPRAVLKTILRMTKI